VHFNVQSSPAGHISSAEWTQRMNNV